jgi:2-methylisocitrate lyase-like PEP mutase family enzyme
VIAVEEAVGKFRAATRVRDQLDRDCVLIARTDVLGVPGGTLDDAIGRVNAYLEAGADWGFVEGPTSVEDIRRLAREVRGPLVYNQAGVSPRLTTEQLRDLGVAVVLFPGAMLRAGLYAMHDYAAQLRAGGGAADAQFSARTANHALADLHRFAGLDQILAWEEEFLP